jgi:RimJ/RimL family protein N-acetyltransferase
LGEIEAAVQTCIQAGNRQIALLRCVSTYPADPATMDLRSLATLHNLGLIVGLSDHTRDNVAAIASVSLGAKMIEKHFIVDRRWGGPDSFFSLEPDEFKRMVADVRTTEAALGKTRFGPCADEENSVTFRRSLFVARDVAAGAPLTCDDVRSVRPSHGLAPRYLPEVLGRVAARALKAAEPLSWSMVGGPPAGPNLVLSKATRDDGPLLLEWRNDALTRDSSWSTAVVEPAEHARWLEQSLAGDSRWLYVARVDGVPVGQVRLDLRSSGNAEISVTVAPSARGKGYAAWLLRAAEEEARKSKLVSLRAEIKDGNERSLRAFKAAGYYGFVTTTHGEVRSWRCERRVARFGT